MWSVVASVRAASVERGEEGPDYRRLRDLKVRWGDERGLATKEGPRGQERETGSRSTSEGET